MQNNFAKIMGRKKVYTGSTQNALVQNLLNLFLFATFRMSELIDFLPKCYYADESVIVLENLVVSKGYGLLPHDGHDFNTAR